MPYTQSTFRRNRWCTKRADGKRFVVRADETLSAFLELELAGRRAQRLIWRRKRPALTIGPNVDRSEEGDRA